MDQPIEAEVVEERGSALALAHAPQAPVSTGLFNTDDPKIVIQKAVGVADALMEIVKSKGWARRIGPKDHLEIQAWQTIAAMLGVSTECEWSRRTDDASGWEARVVVRNARGQTIASAESQCSKSEKKWSDRDDYALRSMAQTRATSKALRMALGFIANIAGFDATPADEVPEHEPPRREPPKAQANPVKERLKELLRDERLTPSERDAAIYEVTGSSEVSSIASEDLAQQVIAKLEKMLQLATDVEIPF